MLRSAAHLAQLQELLDSDEELVELSNRRRVFFLREGQWHQSERKLLGATEWQRIFSRALLEPSYLLVADTVVRGVSTYDVVVAIQLKNPSQADAAKSDRMLRRLMAHAEDRFAADFDKLTVAPSRRQLERKLHELATRVAEYSVPRDDGKSAVVMVLDLDNFKQANDSRSHEFGDALLRVTAWRLEQFAAEQKRTGRLAQVSAGRWGGEEFVFAALFPSDPNEIQSVALDLVRRFAKPPMPEQRSEVQKLRHLYADLTLSLEPPKIPVTASLGWTVLTPPILPEDVQRTVEEAVNRADAAMYRAKQIGKNTAVGFDRIVAEHGRVIEHRADAGVVVIDIGRFVGVRKGDEFAVLPASFANEEDLVIGDGRTQKVLGKYPSLSVARIRVVREPEREAAFCSITSLRRGISQISTRAHLRRIDRPKKPDSPAEAAPLSPTQGPEKL